MSDRRRGLGRGLGALIPTAPPRSTVPGEKPPGSPVDVFFPDRSEESRNAETPAAHDAAGARGPAAPGTAAEPRPDEPRPGDRTHGDAPSGDAPSGATTGPTPPGDVTVGAEPGGSDPSPAEAGNAAPTDQGAAPDSTDEPERPALTPVPGAHYAEIELDAIRPNPRQPRQVFDADDMAELVHSLKEVGLLQPVVVRPVTDGFSDSSSEGYELIVGERRWRAAREAGWDRIPAIVRLSDDDDLLRDALLENLHRSQLNPLEEAAAYGQLLEDFGCTHEELASRIGRSRPQVSNTLRLLKLPALVQRRVAAGVISAGHARALLGLDDAAAQERLAQRVVAEGLSVRTVEELVALGGDGAPAPRSRARVPKPVAPRLNDIAARLADRFETRVKVDLGRTKGRIVVEFATLDDLERIVGQMTPEADGQP